MAKKKSRYNHPLIACGEKRLKRKEQTDSGGEWVQEGGGEDKEEKEVVVVVWEVLDPLDNRGGMVQIFTARWRLARKKAS